MRTLQFSSCLSIIRQLSLAAFGLSIPQLAQADLSPPVAVGSADPMSVTEGCAGPGEGAVTFVHSASFDPASPERAVVEYQWLFDVANRNDPGFDRINWVGLPMDTYSSDGKAFHTRSADARPGHEAERNRFAACESRSRRVTRACSHPRSRRSPCPTCCCWRVPPT